MDDIRGHRPEHRDHRDRKPVDPGHITVGADLQHHRSDEHDEPAHHCQIRIDVMDEVVRGGLAERRRQQLDRPKDRGDAGRHLERDRSANQGHLGRRHAALDRGRQQAAQETSKIAAGFGLPPGMGLPGITE